MTEAEGGEAAAVETTPQAAPEAAVSSQDSAPERNYETEAKELGWVPKDEFKGDPSRWRDAESYVKRGEEFVPFIKKQNKLLADELNKLKTAHTEEVTRMGKLYDGLSKRLKAEYEDKLATLEAQREAAVSAGNVPAFKAADAKIDALKAEAVAEAKTEPKQDDATVESDWVAKNGWYKTDPAMFRAATDYSQMIARPDLPLKDNLAMVEAYMRENYPDKFGGKKPAANGHAAVDGGSAFPTATGNRTKGWDDLPSDAKAAGERFVKDGTFKDKAAYAKAYYEEN